MTHTFPNQKKKEKRNAFIKVEMKQRLLMVQLLEQQQEKPTSWRLGRLINQMKGILELQCCPDQDMKVSIGSRERNRNNFSIF